MAEKSKSKNNLYQFKGQILSNDMDFLNSRENLYASSKHIQEPMNFNLMNSKN